MVSTLRKRYNRQFSEEQYNRMLNWIIEQYQHRPAFRIAESPLFLTPAIRDQILEACDEIVDFI
ncbi:MAG: hypothetical protein R3350_01155, partial [Saprospiraceae bacterium]|nr:hypothetical protein [Saprospiraceae bacterium]